jgi:hypothetical protein
MRYIVCDLDGTLCNLCHRLYLIRCPKPDWNTFFKKAAEDDVNDWCRKIINAFHGRKEIKVLLVSGRTKSSERLTRKWLKENDVRYDKLFLLRPDGDSTPDEDLKRKWLLEFGKQKIMFVIDDRTKVVQMWRDEGLVCLQCAHWEEYKCGKGDGDDKHKVKQ